MKLFLIGLLGVFCAVFLAGASAYPYYPGSYGYGIGSHVGAGVSGGGGGIFSMLIFLFVFIIIINLLFGGGLNNNGGSSHGTTYGKSNQGSNYGKNNHGSKYDKNYISKTSFVTNIYYDDWF